MYIAYQTWKDEQGRLFRRVYGRGRTPEEAIFDARHEIRGGQVWAKQHVPNASQLDVCHEESDQE